VVERAAKLVLASASPRRLALLERAGLAPDLLNPADVDETPQRRESPRRLSIRLAEEKAAKAKNQPLVRNLEGDVYVLGADTVVGLGRRILPKAESRDDAYQCLTLLSGRSHWVYSSVCLIDPKGSKRTRCSETKVRFKRFSREDIDTYLASEEWRGKAGGYAIQGRAEAFVRYLSGSYSGVMGLPLYETLSLLQGAGFPVHTVWAEAGLTGV
jgi:septum formation protein